jgi:O-antigen ligase
MKYYNSQKIVFSYLAALYALPKLIFNSEGDPAGLTVVNSTLIINAIATLTIILLIAASRVKPKKIRLDGLFLITFLYYIVTAVSATYSLNKLITLYWSFVGLGFYLVSLYLAEFILEKALTVKNAFILLNTFLLRYSVMIVFVNIIFYLLYFQSKFSFLGVSSDFAAMLMLYATFSTAILKNTQRYWLFFLMAIVASAFLNSFSSIISIIVGIIVYLFISGKYKTSILIVIFILFSANIFYFYLLQNIGEYVFLDKNAEAFLTGSGRFNLYEISLQIYLDEFSIFRKIFGVGFMGERAVLEGRDLGWITDPHNSFILNMLDLGIIGIIFYIIFTVYPFVYLRFMPVEKVKFSRLFLFFHISCIVFGLTSSYYIGKPSIVLIFSLAYFSILKYKYISPRESIFSSNVADK